MDFDNIFHMLIMMNINNNNISLYDKYIILIYYVIIYFIILYLPKKINTFNNLYNKFNKKCIITHKIEIIRLDIYLNYDSHFNNISEAILWKFYNKYNKIKFNHLSNYNIKTRLYKNNSNEFNTNYNIPCDNNIYNLDEDIYIKFRIDETTICLPKNMHDNSDNIVNDKNKTDIYIDIITYKYNYDYLNKYINKILYEYNKWHDDIDKNNLYIYTSHIDFESRQYLNRYNFISYKTFDNLFFNDKDILMNRLDKYIKNDFYDYRKLGVPHTLGFLFHGEPGCGKTSCIKAIANHLNRHIISIKMNHILNIDNLRNLFLKDTYYGNGFSYTIPKNKKIFVFEEIDCITNIDNNPFISRNIIDNKVNNKNSIDSIIVDKLLDKNNDKNNNNNKEIITLGDILELLDGICEIDDRIIIFTTNDITKLDKALLRPGRIDLIIEFKKLKKDDINNLFKLWFNKDIPSNYFNKIKDYSITQAEFGKLCLDNRYNPDNVIKKLLN